MPATPIKTEQIERDPVLQPRLEINRDLVLEYAADIQAGAKMPAITVFFDGKLYWLADGWHRLFAAEEAGYRDIYADIRPGTRREALLHSVGANARHGSRRTNADKRRAVDIMLLDPEWSQLTDEQIGKLCSVSHTMVASRRPRERLVDEYVSDATPIKYVILPTFEPKLTGSGAIAVNPAPQAVSASVSKSNEPRVQRGKVDPLAVPAGFPADLFPPDNAPWDYEAEKLRRHAMSLVKGLAALPPARDVLFAWAQDETEGDPPSEVVKASAWLAEYAAGYSAIEPVRRARMEAKIEAITGKRPQQASSPGQSQQAAA